MEEAPQTEQHSAAAGHHARPDGGHHGEFRARIDGREVHFDTPHPTGEELLHKVGKRSCAFALIEELRHHHNDVVEPGERVNLTKHELKGFITAHKEIVTISINGDPYTIERGNKTVAAILAIVGQTLDGYTLFEENDGPPMPLPPDAHVKVHGCEVFHSQVKNGASS